MPRVSSIAALLCLALPAVSRPLAAQMHKVAPPEKVTRAVAVYEWTGDLAKPTAARIVPVTLFINGHMEEAGTYLTQPMPFALQTGDVYSIERAGKAQGTVDIDYARNILPPGSTADVAAVGAWYGYGKYAPLPPPSKPKPLKASAHPSAIVGGVNDDDDRPHFVGKQPNQPDDTPTPTKSSTGSTTTASDDPDRPHLGRRDGDGGTTTTASTDTGPVPDSDPDRPTLRHRDPEPEGKQKKQKQSDSAVIPMATSLNDDPNRPTMRRGKPAGGDTTPELKTLPLDLHQVVAVSDPANREPHIFTREWDSPTDRTETLTALEALAQPRIAKYLTTYRLTPAAIIASPAKGAGAPDLSHLEIGVSTTPSAATPSTHPNSRRTPKPQPNPPPPPTLLEEQLTPYTLSYGGLPTFVYTAQSPIAVGGPVYITLVAQRLPSGEMQVALSSVTDAAHLDRTPWLRPIDAVDPDWSHRADLLFEVRAQTTRQFALYRLTTAQAEQQFITGTIQ